MRRHLDSVCIALIFVAWPAIILLLRDRLDPNALVAVCLADRAPGLGGLPAGPALNHRDTGA